MTIATIKLDTPTKLSFAVAITGASGIPETRFIIEDKKFSISYPCTQTNEGSEVEISGLQHILKAGDYQARLEIVLENKLYVPLRDVITFEPTVEIVTKTKPAQVKESVLISNVKVNVQQSVVNENFLRKTHAANIIAKSLHYTPSGNETSQQIIAHAIEQSSPMTQAQLDTLKEMLKLAESVGLKFENVILPALIQEIKTTKAPVKPESDEESEQDVDDMIGHIVDWEHIIDVYDPEDLIIIDDETGETLDDDLTGDLKESELNEVLSRVERLKSKIRFARTSGNRQRAARIALRRHSSNAVINKRARRLAVKTIETKLARGKPLNTLSVVEKMRIEKIVQSKTKLVSRLAMKLTSRIKNIERDRLSHGNQK